MIVTKIVGEKTAHHQELYDLKDWSPDVMRKIPVSEPDLRGNEKKYVVDCMNSGWISSRGEYVGKFE